ncbi:MAG: sulfatase-like hydrolase/transferase [Clostridia bacterium]|nr:sulfatase-like hydrolase/transferase [Clostridia bacterium]
MQFLTDAIVYFFTSSITSKFFDVFLFMFSTIFGVYWIIGFFFTRKFAPAKKQHKYAICIAARNEEAVIGNLLDSIAAQDYPAELLSVFVVADNCTDSTAEVARSKGAVCYERFNDTERTKGFALKYLFECIDRDYGCDSFEGYFIFDADNLLYPDYVSRMNESFDAGLKIITSYRNTKNFDENWVASTYALHWLRSSRKNHRARSFLRLATNIQGTGFLFSNIFVKDGWKYTSLTEDRAFTADAVARGYEISYNDSAMFYDEQPTSIRIALRQRLRWSKGHLIAFKEKGWALLKNVIFGNRYADKELRKPTLKGRFTESIRHRVASFDTLRQLCPLSVIFLVRWIIFTVTVTAVISYTQGYERIMFTATSGNWVIKLLYFIFGDATVKVEPGITAILSSIGVLIALRAISKAWSYIKNIPIAVYVFITERKRIIYIPWYKKLLYCLTFPVFDSIHRYTTYAALFVKVTWKPIPHTSKVTITDIAGNKDSDISKKEQKQHSGRAKRVFKACLPYIVAALPFVMMDVFIRILAADINYHQAKMVAPSIIFSVLWVAVILVTTAALPRIFGRIVYGISFGLFFVAFLTNSIYFSYTGFFFPFKMLTMAGAGKSYIWDTVKSTDPLVFVIAVVILISAVIAIILIPKHKKSRHKLLIAGILIFVLLHALTPLMYGRMNDTLKWDSWRNPANVYRSFNDSNKNIKVSGFYEYCVRDFFTSVFESESEMTPEDEKALEEMFASSTPHKENEYTGIFEGENVIFLQLEGIDDWLLTEEDMPNLYGMQQSSISFTQHYSYYTGGGSTFNSELAVNTGFITPVTYYRNAYTFTSNFYSQSLPNIFSSLGYSVNAFHMNTGEYYSRGLNYKNWGYDNYFGLLDSTEYTDKSYELDRELILNEEFNNAMFDTDGPFLHYIITFTPHTPFTTEDYKGNLLATEKYGKDIPDLTEEDCVRLLARETDNMVGLLLKELEERGLADDTVIVAFSDHYLYTLKDKTILENNGKITENNLINHTPFFIWSKDTQSVTVDKVNSQIDILPTLLNMFGIEYNDESYIGKDIMSDEYSGYVFFSDYSWYDGSIYAENGEVISGETDDPDYVAEMSALVSSLIQKNDLIQKYDYFREIQN